MEWCVYILKSLKDNKKYIGSTNNISRRLLEHNNGKVTSTKNRKPFILLYTEKLDNEKETRFREKYYKTHKGYNELTKKLKNI